MAPITTTASHVTKLLIIDREAREIMHLVASVRLSVCLSVCLRSHGAIRVITSPRCLSVCL